MMPRNPDSPRVSTAMRLAPDLLDRLDGAARDRMMSRNRLVEVMLGEALDLLLPVEPLQRVLRTPASDNARAGNG